MKHGAILISSCLSLYYVNMCNYFDTYLFFRKHLTEAKENGIPEDSVPNIEMPSYEDLMNQILKLQQQQEQMLADIRQKSSEARDEVKNPEVDPEFEQEIRGLDISKSQKEALINEAKKRRKELQQQIEAMKEKLKKRKDRKLGAELTEEEMQSLGEEEKKNLMKVREAQGDADRNMEEEAILSTIKIMERVSVLSPTAILNK